MWLFNRQSHYQCVFYFKSEKYIGSYNSQSDPTIYDLTYLQRSYVGSRFWQPWPCAIHESIDEHLVPHSQAMTSQPLKMIHSKSFEYLKKTPKKKKKDKTISEKEIEGSFTNLRYITRFK